jgi:hypothetical protein
MRGQFKTLEVIMLNRMQEYLGDRLDYPAVVN